MFRIGIAALAVCAVIMTSLAASSAFADEPMPPLVPTGEIPSTQSDPVFASCITAITPLTQQLGAKLGIAHITESAKWGLVWRADFSLDGGNPRAINRIVCWKGRVAIALGQDVAPLDVGL